LLKGSKSFCYVKELFFFKPHKSLLIFLCPIVDKPLQKVAFNVGRFFAHFFTKFFFFIYFFFFINIILNGSSEGNTYATLLWETTVFLIKGAGQVITETSLFPVTSNMVSHGARIYLTSNSGTANIINIGLISARVHKAR